MNGPPDIDTALAWRGRTVRDQDGNELRLPFDRSRFDDAPDIDPDVELTEEQERVLHQHYGREWAGRAEEETGDAMIRSEEEVSVSKTVKPAERVRLKKVIVEDEATETVPVRREEIRLETEPPPEGRIEDVDDDPRP